MVSSINAADLSRELEWFSEVLDARLKLYFGTGPASEVAAISPPKFSGSNSPYASFVRDLRLSASERLVVVLALIPHIRPQALDVLLTRNDATDRGFTEFGGLRGATHGGFIPTGETAAFILGGDNLDLRFEALRLFDGEHFFARDNVLSLGAVVNGEPFLSGPLVIEREYLHRLTTGIQRKPNFNSEFPARLIETRLGWDDLVLPTATLEQLGEIRNWMLHRDRLLCEWQMESKLQPGFVALFHGPPGTGKTFSACLLGKHCGCDVYRVDLSMVVSKYIGETEKNLARVFDIAEHRNWILFFDEADALFARRTHVDDSHDMYANQQVSFLLQRIEAFGGVVLLASNLKANIDDAFMRRFQSVISFPMPKAAERERIWRKAFSDRCVLEDGIDLGTLAEKFELSGGTIMNVVRHASLKSLSRDENVIRLTDVEEGIRRELLKEGRAL